MIVCLRSRAKTRGSGGRGGRYFSPFSDVCGAVLQGQPGSLCQLMAWCVTFVLIEEHLDESGIMH